MNEIQTPRRDEVLTEFRIGEYQDRVILKFNRPIEVVVFTREQARECAQQLLLHAGSVILPPS